MAGRGTTGHDTLGQDTPGQDAQGRGAQRDDAPGPAVPGRDAAGHDRAARGAAPIVATVCGAATVVAYAVLLGVDALVHEPRAAAPTLTATQVDAALAETDWASGRAQVLVAVALGALLAVGAAVLAVRRRWGVPVVVTVFLTLLALGAPTAFVATFSSAMTIADTFLTHGGVHTVTGHVLRVVSAGAALAAVVVAVVAARRIGARSAGPAATRPAADTPVT